MHRAYTLIITFSILINGLFIPLRAENAPQTPQIVARFERGSQAGQVGIRPSMPDFLGEGPQALAVAPDGIFYLLDSYNQRILRYDPASARSEVIPLPDGTGAFDLAVQSDLLYVLDGFSMAVLQLDQGGNLRQTYPILDETGSLSSHLTVTPAGEVHWQILDRRDYVLAPYSETQSLVSPRLSAGLSPALNPDGAVTMTSQRIDRQSGTVYVNNTGKNTVQPLNISVSEYLGSANLIAVDKAGNDYILVEEVLEDVGAIIVETTVWRFSADGKLQGIARVPLEENELLPHRFVTVSPDGEVFFLAVKSDAAQIFKLAFEENYQSHLPLMRQIVQFGNTAANSSQPPLPEGAKGITRDQIMQTANDYMNVNWVLGSANYHTGPTPPTDWSGCGSSDHWKLPRYLAGRLNQTIAEVPYQYGGKQSISAFRDRINNGRWAGNICSEGIFSSSAGIDCSGFVQNCWQTSVEYLPNVSYSIGWSELRRGDMVTSSSHTILIEGFINGGDIYGGAYTYESTMTSQVDRVVHWTRSWSTLSGYAPRRYNNVSEDPPAMIPAYQNIVINGGFDTNNLQNWWAWGDADWAFYGSGILCFKRHTGGNGGCIGQNWDYFVPVNSTLEITVQLGNASPVTKYPGVHVKSGNKWDISCWFTIPPNSPLRTYTIRGKNLSDWYGMNIEVWPDPPDAVPDVLMDNVTLTYRPDISISGTQCFNPDTTAPGGNVDLPADGATLGSPATSFTASAWDNDGGTGVQRVEFHIFYDGMWHLAGEDTTSPYGLSWNVPQGLQSQQLTFTIHVVDYAGNEIMDPGGYHYVQYKSLRSYYLPIMVR